MLKKKPTKLKKKHTKLSFHDTWKLQGAKANPFDVLRTKFSEKLKKHKSKKK